MKPTNALLGRRAEMQETRGELVSNSGQIIFAFSEH